MHARVGAGNRKLAPAVQLLQPDDGNGGSASGTKFKGLCYASWSTAGSDSYDSSASDASIAKAAISGINTLAITNTWYMENQNSTSIAFSDTKSNTVVGVKRAIASARRQGLRVAVKPHVDFLADDSHWRGEIGPNFSDADWVTWFASYTKFMLAMAQVAADENVELFIVGTELITTEPREADWRALIKQLRTAVKGTAQLVYGANWSPGPAHVPWWDALDYIGVDAYYPLTTSRTNPGVPALAAAWHNNPAMGGLDLVGSLKNLSASVGKPLMFCEIGYTTTAACAAGNHAGGDLDMQAQADAYSAFFESVYQEPWFAGVFVWDWETNPREGGRCVQ
jgi:hypothetical protein